MEAADTKKVLTKISKIIVQPIAQTLPPKAQRPIYPVGPKPQAGFLAGHPCAASFPGVQPCLDAFDPKRVRGDLPMDFILGRRLGQKSSPTGPAQIPNSVPSNYTSRSQRHGRKVNFDLGSALRSGGVLVRHLAGVSDGAPRRYHPPLPPPCPAAPAQAPHPRRGAGGTRHPGECHPGERRHPGTSTSTGRPPTVSGSYHHRPHPIHPAYQVPRIPRSVRAESNSIAYIV